MKTLSIALVLILAGCANAQCQNGQCPIPQASETEINSVTAPVCGNLRQGNATVLQTGLINLTQGMTRTSGSQQRATIGKQRFKQRILFRWRR